MSQPPGDRDRFFGEKAVEHGLITQQQLDDALAEQAVEIARGRGAFREIADILIARGSLTEDSVTALLSQNPAGAPRSRAQSPAPMHITPPPRRAAPVPTRLGKYALVRELGQGGMGVVYEALDTQLNRKVALKFLITSVHADPEEVKQEEARFLREAQITAKLKHPNIATVYETGTVEGRPFLAMEFLEGVPLSKWRKTGSITIRQQVAILRDAALAVQYAHDQKILHRDLKPENVMVTSGNHVYVMDFGLAKAMGRQGKSLTGAGMVVGTPAYISPEQARGLKTVDRRTDIYSLGVMLYEILTGKTPYDGETAVDIFMKSAGGAAPAPSRVMKALPTHDKSLDNVCMRAMAREPKDRYPTVRAMADDLTRWLKGRSVRATAPKERRVLPGWVYAAGAGALLLTAGVFFIGRQNILGEKTRVELAARTAEMEKRMTAEILESLERKRKAAEEAARPPAPDPWLQAVNLLPLVDPKRDAVSGTWTRQADILQCDKLKYARIEIPYVPPDEYDLRIAFTRRDGNADVAVILSKSGKAFVWTMGANGNTIFGFSPIRGTSSNLNPTTVRSERCLENGRMYSAVVQVRRDGVKAFLDGTFITQWKTDYSDIGASKSWKLRDEQLIGVATYDSPTLFHAVEVLEITGRGVRISSAPPPATRMRAPVVLRTLGGHKVMVWSLAFSPDGTILASSSSDMTAKLWSTATGNELRVLAGHTAPIRSIAFRPDGKGLLTSSFDKTAKLWDTANGKELRSLGGFADLAEGAAFSPDDALLAVGCKDGTIKLWKTATWTPLGTIEGHLKGVIGVVFSPDGKKLASSSHDTTVRLWDASSRRETLTLRGHTSSVESVRFSPDGRTLATASMDLTVRIWNASDGKSAHTLQGHTAQVYDVAFSPDGRILVSGGSDRTIRFWDPSTGAVLQTITGHAAAIRTLAFSPDGTILVSGSADGKIIMWDLKGK